MYIYILHLECLPPYLHVESYTNTSELPATLFNPRTNWWGVHLPHLKGSKSKKISWQRAAKRRRLAVSWAMDFPKLWPWEKWISDINNGICQFADFLTNTRMISGAWSMSAMELSPWGPWLGCAGWRCRPAPVEWSPSHFPGSPGDRPSSQRPMSSPAKKRLIPLMSGVTTMQPSENILKNTWVWLQITKKTSVDFKILKKILKH